MHIRIAQPYLVVKHCQVQAHAPACLPFLPVMTLCVSNSLCPLFGGPAVVCLLAGKHSSCFPSLHFVFDAAATILKYILKYKVVVTSQHLVHVLINITVHLFKPRTLTGLVFPLLTIRGKCDVLPLFCGRSRSYFSPSRLP